MYNTYLRLKNMHQKIIDPAIFKYFVKEIDDAFPVKRHQRAKNEDVAFQMLRVLRYGVPWRDTGCMGAYSWQTIHRRCAVIMKANLIKQAWEKIVSRYAMMKNKKNGRHFKNLFVDTTFIKNIGGIDCVGKNSTDRGRKATKISVVCDENRTIIGCYASPCSHDARLVENTLDTVPFDIEKLRKKCATFIVADKAYASYNLSDRLEKRNLTLITDRKRRQKRFTNVACSRASARKKLAMRCVVEHAFGIMKRFKRVARREDRLCDHYMTFFYLGIIIRILQECPSCIF